MYHIKVLQHHIDEGVRKNAFHCAIALAIREQIPDVDAASVSVGDRAHFNGKHYLLPPEASSFVCCFDRGCIDPDHVKPFEFDITELLWHW